MTGRKFTVALFGRAPWAEGFGGLTFADGSSGVAAAQRLVLMAFEEAR